MRKTVHAAKVVHTKHGNVSLSAAPSSVQFQDFPILGHSHTFTLSHSHTLSLSYSHTLILSHTLTHSHTFCLNKAIQMTQPSYLRKHIFKVGSSKKEITSIKDLYRFRKSDSSSTCYLSQLRNYSVMVPGAVEMF